MSLLLFEKTPQKIFAAFFGYMIAYFWSRIDTG